MSVIVAVGHITGRVLRKARALLGRSTTERYEPAAYWERRARELVEGYDAPETWAGRGWVSGGNEEGTVVELLRAADVRSVLVAGAGSGRQYAYLRAAGFAVSGFDISPTLVETCRDRYPDVRTEVVDVAAAADVLEPADAVLSVNVLQHVPPDRLPAAAASLAQLARSLIVVRELTQLAAPSAYQWAHDYDAAFAGWERLAAVTTDELESARVEVLAWRRRAIADPVA